MRTATALAAGIILGVALTLTIVQVTGGWYTYEVRPISRCHPESGPTIGVPEPVPNSAHPCLFRRPRWSLTD